MRKMPRITGRDMIRFLVKQEFVLRRIAGSHHVMRRDNTQTVVPVHGNHDLAIGTLRGILRDIKMSPEEFERLWKEL